MQGLQQSYTQYFNRKHRKVGHLFQGRYKAIVCEKDEYLLTLVRYIHLNPIRAKLVQKPDDYPYRGHREYCGGRVGSPKKLTARFTFNRCRLEASLPGTQKGSRATARIVPTKNHSKESHLTAEECRRGIHLRILGQQVQVLITITSAGSIERENGS
jgi:hypothetical protein